MITIAAWFSALALLLALAGAAMPHTRHLPNAAYACVWLVAACLIVAAF